MLRQLRRLANRSDCGSGIEVAAALAIVGATTGGVTAYMSARQAEKAAKAQEKYEVKAFKENARQIESQMQMERFKSVNRANFIRSRIRVAAGESGIGYGGTYMALMNQADYDDYITSDIIGQNAANAIRAAQSQLRPRPATINPLIAGLLGGLQGAGSGLQMGTSIAGMPKRTPATTPPTTPAAGYDISGPNYAYDPYARFG